MKHKAVKIGLTGLVLAIALGGLLFTTLSEATEYYKHVDEVMAQPDDWYGKKLQLHGFAKSVTRTRNSLEWRFQVESNGHVVQATYKGVAPDTFKNDSEVVLKGVLTADGFTVSPNGIMAKCPSKYDPQSAAAAGPKSTGTY
jgi:cytochrome c-type biogenesis protein CcmE